MLAAGALSLAELAIEPKGDDGASDYVREATDVTTAPAPKPSSSHDIDRPGPVDSPSTAPPPTRTPPAPSVRALGPAPAPVPRRCGLRPARGHRHALRRRHVLHGSVVRTESFRIASRPVGHSDRQPVTALEPRAAQAQPDQDRVVLAHFLLLKAVP